MKVFLLDGKTIVKKPNGIDYSEEAGKLAIKCFNTWRGKAGTVSDGTRSSTDSEDLASQNGVFCRCTEENVCKFMLAACSPEKADWAADCQSGKVSIPDTPILSLPNPAAMEKQDGRLVEMFEAETLPELVLLDFWNGILSYGQKRFSICPVCGKMFKKPITTKVFCSNRCSRKSQNSLRLVSGLVQRTPESENRSMTGHSSGGFLRNLTTR